MTPSSEKDAPIDEKDPVTTEPQFALHSLRPEYKEVDHGLYVGYLRDELNRPARKKEHADQSDAVLELRPRNIALTGSYGSGKSSILSKVVEELGDRVVSVSLSTLGNDEFKSGGGPSKDPLETPAITNAIQKEIVKQLLYREKPSNVPGSRYRRIESFQRSRAFRFSALIAAGFTALAFLTGWTARVEAIVNNDPWLSGLAYLAMFVLVTLIAYSVQNLFHNRVWIDKLTSGPASVTLTDKTESFFDKYLDEIVYFFEANKYDVVVFEDLDRFNDPYIFETLRELNTLLNNSKQIEPRIITFVYAIKDSIFEQLGKISVNGVELSEDEIRRLAVTNRTKFFDLVIPVVPFISHRNARDLASKEMKTSGFAIDKALLDLVSKHMVDMRLIKNVHNEFGIFRQKILRPNSVDELNAQALFAMVVYKNLNMADFEKVKEGGSALDDVYSDFRALVNQEIAAADRQIRIAQASLRKLDSVESRSRELGDSLEEYLERLLRHSGTSLAQATFTLASAVELADLRGAAFWKSWLSDPALSLTASYTTTVTLNYYGQHNIGQTIDISLDDARKALGDPLALVDWEAADKRSLRAEIERSSALRKFLKHATMKQMFARPELTSDEGGDSLLAAAEGHLGKGLALDLLVSGYIDGNFSLYVSLYYDDMVTARARNYILHSVETDTMDINAEIGASDQIDAMLEETGDSIFSERSIYNVQLFNHLLSKGDGRLEQSMRLLARAGDDERKFLAAYFANGNEVEKLVARLTPLWSGALVFLLSDESVADDDRVKLLDLALGSISGAINYEVGPDLGKFLREHFDDFTTLVGSGAISSAEAVIAVLANAQVRLASLDAVSAQLKQGIVEASLYELTQHNLLIALGGEEDLALDKIRSLNDSVFKYITTQLATYVEIQKASSATKFTIGDYKNFIPVLNELVDCEPNDVLAVVQGSTSVTLNKITALNEALWPVVAQTLHLATNYANIDTYIEKRGKIDDELALLLNASSAITDVDAADEASKRGLAVAIANSPAVNGPTRIKLIKSLAIASPLLASEIAFDDDDPTFAGLLVKSSLIEDSTSSYAALEESAWPVKRAYIAESQDFPNYMQAIAFSPSDFQALAEDPMVPGGVKSAILLDLDGYPHSSSRSVLEPLAQFAVTHGISVGPAKLLTMATSGVRSSALVGLIALELTTISPDDLFAVLRLMPERYSKLTTKGGSTKLPVTAEDIQLADWLISKELVSSRDPSPSGSQFKVNLRRRFAS